MKRCGSRLALFLLLFSLTGCSIQWQEFSAPDGTFKVKMPGTPVSKSSFGANGYVCEASGVCCTVVYADLNGAGAFNPFGSVSRTAPSPQLLLSSLTSSLLAKGGKSVYTGSASSNGLSGAEAELDIPAGTSSDGKKYRAHIAVVRIFTTPKRVYIVAFEGNSISRNSASVQTFMNSFQLTGTEASNGGATTMPGMASSPGMSPTPGMPGMTPPGDQMASTGSYPNPMGTAGGHGASTPMGTYPPPAGAGATPMGTYPPPAGAGATPMGTYPPPAGTSTTPMGTYPPPAGMGTTPMGTYPPPAGTGTTPMGTYPPPAGAGSTPMGTYPPTAGTGTTPMGTYPPPAGAGSTPMGTYPPTAGTGTTPMGTTPMGGINPMGGVNPSAGGAVAPSYTGEMVTEDQDLKPGDALQVNANGRWVDVKVVRALPNGLIHVRTLVRPVIQDAVPRNQLQFPPGTPAASENTTPVADGSLPKSSSGFSKTSKSNKSERPEKSETSEFRGFDDATVDELLKIVADKREKRRVQAAEKLREHSDAAPNADVSKKLIALLKVDERTVRIAVARALEKWVAPEVYPSVLKALSDDTTEVRQALFPILVQGQVEGAAEAIGKRLENQEDRKAAVAALIQIGAKAESVALKALEHSDSKVRLAACDVLKEIGGQESIAALKKATGSWSGSDRISARKALQAVEERK